MTLIHAMGDEPEDRPAEIGEFEAWFRREYPKVFGSMILAIGSRDLAEEATAEAFTRAYERWNRVGSMTRAGGWVYVVALNEARQRQRRMAVERVLLMRWRPPAEVPTETAQRSGISFAVFPRELTAIVLRYVADLSEAQVDQTAFVGRWHRRPAGAGSPVTSGFRLGSSWLGVGVSSNLASSSYGLPSRFLALSNSEAPSASSVVTSPPNSFLSRWVIWS